MTSLIKNIEYKRLDIYMGYKFLCDLYFLWHGKSLPKDKKKELKAKIIAEFNEHNIQQNINADYINSHLYASQFKRTLRYIEIKAYHRRHECRITIPYELISNENFLDDLCLLPEFLFKTTLKFLDIDLALYFDNSKLPNLRNLIRQQIVRGMYVDVTISSKEFIHLDLFKQIYFAETVSDSKYCVKLGARNLHHLSLYFKYIKLKSLGKNEMPANCFIQPTPDYQDTIISLKLISSTFVGEFLDSLQETNEQRIKSFLRDVLSYLSVKDVPSEQHRIKQLIRLNKGMKNLSSEAFYLFLLADTQGSRKMPPITEIKSAKVTEYQDKIRRTKDSLRKIPMVNPVKIILKELSQDAF